MTGEVGTGAGGSPSGGRVTGEVGPGAGGTPSGAAGRATRSRANTRARLIEAARNVFVERGIEGASVDDLVGAAGFTRGAFYSNFNSMSDVFHEVFTVMVSETLTALQQAIAEIPEDRMGIGAVFEVLNAYVTSELHAYVLTRELELFALRDGEGAAVYYDYQTILLDTLEPMVTEGLRRMGRRPAIPVRRLAQALVALYMDAIGREVHGEDRAGSHEALLAIFEAFVVGASEPM